jgi:hypothetical protein
VVVIDSYLTWEAQVDKICNKINRLSKISELDVMQKLHYGLMCIESVTEIPHENVTRTFQFKNRERRYVQTNTWG